MAAPSGNTGNPFFDILDDSDDEVLISPNGYASVSQLDHSDPDIRSAQPAAAAAAAASGSSSSGSRSGRSGSHSGGERNPFTSLGDIAKSGHFEGENDNLALFEGEIHDRPKVAQVLHKLVRFTKTTPEDDYNISAERSMVALKRKSQEKMGTLTGVYLPTIQNILGVILFLRFSWIVGIAGVAETLLIVAVCCTTTLLTAISMSAIATNGVVPAGGSYFMISRSLGPEFGGAVGILFYLGTTFASAMYILGAIEILLTYIAPSLSLFGDISGGGSAMLNNMRFYGTMLLAAMGLIVFIGVKYVNRFANVALAVVIMTIFCIYLGYFASPTTRQPDICLVDGYLTTSSYAGNCSAADAAIYGWQDANTTTYSYLHGIPGLGSGQLDNNAGPNYLLVGETAPGVDARPGLVAADITSTFTLLLAIFFPSVTGIMAGSNRSGDLKDASRSIPKGTIAAILTTSFIYLTSVLFIGSVVRGELLRDKFGDSIGGKLVVAEIAWPHPAVVLFGALMSCIGAGLQSLTGAPRLLQAIASDEVLPFLDMFQQASANGEPTRALILTLLIAELGILIASLDTVAPIITMFFLMCYGFVNLACSLQSLLRSPSWRPRFQYYHWGLSFLGLILCVLLMFISSWVYAVLAMMLAGVIYYYIQYKGAAQEWGDGLRGLSMQAARYSLLRLEDTPPHTKNWRPQLLLLCKLNAELEPAEPRLFDIAEWLKGGKGLTIASAVIEGEFLRLNTESYRGEQSIKKTLRDKGIQGFTRVLASPTVDDGISALIQSSGLGALKHNTVLIGWPEGWRENGSGRVFTHALRTADAGRLAVLVPKNIVNFPVTTDVLTGTIDIWWIVHDGGMLILLAFLLRQNTLWRRCKLRLFTIAESDDNSIQLERDLQTFLYHLRIDATVCVIEMLDGDISAYTYERTVQMEAHQEQIRSSRHGPSAAAFEEGDLSAPESQPHPPQESNLRRMNTSVKLNKLIHEHSHDAEMVILNLPGISRKQGEDDLGYDYLEYIEVLTENLPRALLVRGGGREVITIYS
eukprot:m.123428 g.123428  ORF g.123428 m.123428 type:complete len:1034 (-) comp9648_c0_seq5:1260-4361(-)